MAKFQLVLLIHAHQPVGNFEDVFEKAYRQSYLPFVELISLHPSVKIGLHISGSLLEWIERAHPDYLTRLRELVARGQMELVGGGFYEPILISIPREDGLEQIRRLADFHEAHFGIRPRGAWLAERVWEPHLPSLLAPAGVEYTLVDDNHFLGAGFEPRELFGVYEAEDQGAAVRLIPGLKALRYLIPYRSPEEVVGFLHDAVRERPGGMAAMGDDLEKFGVWPKTYDHCYRDGWLERFFTALEANGDWLNTVTPIEAAFSGPPLGRADLPAASYAEMMEWALPTPARIRFQALEREFASREDVRMFLRGGFWRNFLMKYSEANLLHKKMVRASMRLRELAARRRRAEAFRSGLSAARTQLFRAQCNDAYWHGVFGGLYAPHLRTALWRELVRTEAFADAAAHAGKSYQESERVDFDADGCEEIYFASDRWAALLSPHDGATIEALDFRPRGVTLVNSIMRRPEAYHARLGNLPFGQGGAAISIHDQARAKEEGLERWLRYDRWPRNAFRLLLFPPDRTQQDYATLRLGEVPAIAGGNYRLLELRRNEASLSSPPVEGPTGSPINGWEAEKVFSLAAVLDGFQIICDFKLSCACAESCSINAGMELVANLLAPAAPDRYIEAAGERHPLRWSGTAPASELRLVDEWQKVALTLSAPGARDYWIAPIETISESEDGFERVYQGSQILALWPIKLPPGATWKGRLALKVTPLP